MAEKKGKGKQGKGQRRISVEFYEALVQAFRDNPGNFTRVAKAVGTTRPTAKRAWERGWEKFEWAPPISEVLADEMEVARARIQQAKEAEAVREELVNPPEGIVSAAEQRREAHLQAQADRAAAKEHAIQARKELGEMIEALVKLVRQSEAVLLRRNPGAQALAARVNDEMLKLAKAKGKKFSLAHAMNVLRAHNNDVRSVTMAGRRAFELQQTHLGDPSKIIGVQQTSNFDDATEEELRKEIRKFMEDQVEDDEVELPEPAAVH